MGTNVSRLHVILGTAAVTGHAIGMVADVYTGFNATSDISLGLITSISLESIAPFLQHIALEDALIGHYLAVFFIPFGIFGIWQVVLALDPHRNWESYVLLVLGTLGVAYGAFYHGTLAFLIGALQGDVSKAIELGQESTSLLVYFNSLSEPLGIVLLSTIVVASGLFAFTVSVRRTRFPRWFALYNPVVLQLVLSILIVVSPRPLDQLLWLTVFNLSFALWYLGTTLVIVRAHPRTGV